MSYNSNYIITQISSSNLENNKATGIDQVPLTLSIPGAISLREKGAPYTVTVGTKQVK